MMQKKTIIFVYDTVYPFFKGGGEFRTYQLAKNLSKKGWDIIWYCRKCWKTQEKVIEFDGIKFKAICDYQSTLKKQKQSRRSLFKTLPFLFGLLKEPFPNSARIIFTPQTPLLHFFPIYFKAKLKSVPIPIITDCWEVWGKFWFKYYAFFIAFFGYFIEKLVYILSDHLTPISFSGKKKLKSFKINESKITYLENGIEKNKINNIKPSKKTSDIIYFGRLEKHKNVDIVIKSIPFIIKKFPKIKLHIIGNGKEKNNLYKLVNDLGLKKNIEFFHDLDHDSALSLMKASKLCTQLSTSEGGASIAVNEAHACRLPVIAVKHKQGIDQELIINNQTGIWIEKLNPIILASTIQKLLINGEYKKMDKFLIDPEDCVDWSIISNKLENIIKNFLIS